MAEVEQDSVDAELGRVLGDTLLAGTDGRSPAGEAFSYSALPEDDDETGSSDEEKRQAASALVEGVSSIAALKWGKEVALDAQEVEQVGSALTRLLEAHGGSVALGPELGMAMVLGNVVSKKVGAYRSAKREEEASDGEPSNE